MAIRAVTFESGATAGGAGASTATSASKRVQGTVLAVGLTYVGSPPATSDIILRTTGQTGPARTILSLANVAADGWFDLSLPVVDADGTTPTYNATEPIQRIGIPIDDEVELFVDDANDADSVSAVLLVQD